MDTKSIVEFLITFVVIMIVAFQAQIVQTTKTLHSMPGAALTS